MKLIPKLIPFGIAITLVSIHLLEILTSSSKTVQINEMVISETSQILNSVKFTSIGILLTLLCIILKKKIWKYIFLFLILLSFTGIIQFYSKSFWIGFGNIRIDLNALFLLVTHLIFNKEIIHETQDLFKDNEVDKVESKEALINNFQKKFALKKRVELERIIEENQLIPEALEAPKRLLKEK